jgi:hypothetical protein
MAKRLVKISVTDEDGGPVYEAEFTATAEIGQSGFLPRTGGSTIAGVAVIGAMEALTSVGVQVEDFKD